MSSIPSGAVAQPSVETAPSLRSVRVLVAGGSLRWFGFSFYAFFILLLFHSAFGLTYADAGLYIAAIALVTLPLGQVGGGFADRFGRRRMIIASLAGEAFGLAILAWGITIGSLALSVGALLLSRSFGDVGSAAVFAYVADVTDVGIRARGLSWVRVGDNIGASGGVALAGILLVYIAYGQLTGLAALLVGAGAVVSALWLTPSMWDRALGRASVEGSTSTSPQDRGGLRWLGQTVYASFQPIWHDRTLLWLMVASTLIWIPVLQIFYSISTFGLDFLGIPFGILGLAVALNGLIPAVGQVPLTMALTGRRHTRVGIFGLALYAASFVALGLDAVVRVEVILIFVLAVIVSTIGENMIYLPVFTLPLNIAPENSQGAYAATIGTASGVGSVFAPILAGVALTFAAHPIVTWGILAAPAVPSAAILWYLESRIPVGQNRI